MEIIKNKDLLLISAKEVYNELGIKKKFATWIKTSIERAYLEINKDFIPYKEQSSGGRPLENYLLTKEASLTIIVMSGGQFAKELRSKVINLFNLHDTGKAFTSEQFLALMDISKGMTLISIQKEAERRHYALYNQPENWYEYRAALLGYNKTELISAMQKINKKYKSMRASLIKLDANELIRTGVIDLMITLGKTQKYATEVGDLCKNMAEKMKLSNIIWDDTLANPLQLNSHEIEERKQSLNSSIKTLR